jgi:beta-lactamase regulating signal transducer with metallopeptidase domain
MLWVLENTLIAAILALVVALVSRMARPAPVIRHGLWLVVLIKLIVPPMISIGLPIPASWRHGAGSDRIAGQRSSDDLQTDGAGTGEQLRSPEPEPKDRSLMMTETAQADDPVSDSPPISGGEFAVKAGDFELPGVSPDDSAAIDEIAGLSVLQEHGLRSQVNTGLIAGRVFFWTMIAGTILAGLIQALRLVRLRRLLGRTVPPTDELEALLDDLSGQLGIHPPAVRVSHEIHSPMICALGRAVLIWPASGLKSLRGAALRAVIVHELAHVVRRDHWIGWLELVAGCAWWWNPLFWYVRHQLRENAELACDAWAMGICPDGRRDYARALLALAELDSRQTAAVPALGVGDGSRQLFERRLVMILNERVTFRLGTLGMLGMGLLGLTALVGCSASLADDEPAPVIVESGAAIEVGDVFAPAVQKAVLPALADPVIEAAPSASLPAELVQAPTTSQAQAAPASNEDRLKRLEDKFDALLTELRGLKSGQTDQPAANTKQDPRARAAWKRQPGEAGSEPQNVSKRMWDAPKQAANKQSPFGLVAERPDGATATESKGPIQYRNPKVWTESVTKTAAYDKRVEAVTLTRATYKLLAGKADEIAAFLTANLSDEIEVRVKNGALQVTASSDDQAAISQFIHLLQARGATATKGAAKVNNLDIDVEVRPLPEVPKTGVDTEPDSLDALPRDNAPRPEKAAAPRSNETLPEATPAKR